MAVPSHRLKSGVTVAVDLNIRWYRLNAEVEIHSSAWQAVDCMSGTRFDRGFRFQVFHSTITHLEVDVEVFAGQSSLGTHCPAPLRGSVVSTVNVDGWGMSGVHSMCNDLLMP